MPRQPKLLLLLCTLCCFAASGSTVRSEPEEPLPDFTQWTLEQQVGQLLIWGSTNRPEDLTGILQGDINGGPVPIGGVLLTSKPDRKRADVIALAAFLRTTDATPVPPLICADQEGGKIMALREGVIPMPSALQFAMLTDQEKLDLATAMAEDTHSAGIDVLLAPVIDIDGDPVNPAIGKHERSYGGNPAIVFSSSAMFLEGTWRSGAVPVLKHFPGHGYADFDSHKVLPLVQQSRSDWMRVEGAVYERILREVSESLAQIPIGVMVGHLRWPALTGDDQPTGFSKSLLTNTLREDFGLGDQIIWSDDLLMKALPDPVTSAIAMRKAGIDIILVSREPQTLRDVHKALVKYYRNGWLDRAELEASVGRILVLKHHIRRHWADLEADTTSPAATSLEPTPYF